MLSRYINISLARVLRHSSSFTSRSFTMTLISPNEVTVTVVELLLTGVSLTGEAKRVFSDGISFYFLQYLREKS